MFYWLLKWVLIGPLIKLIFRPTAEGTENVPAEGGAILASNHLSYSDWLFMPLLIPRRVTFVAKAEYFTTPGFKGWLQKTFFSGAGQVPIDRSSGTAAAGAIATGLRILANGELFGIYPEGTRSQDGTLYRGKTGLARMALEAKVPVIPVGVIGTNIVAPPGKIFGKYTRPHLKFGKPLDFSRYQGMEDDRFVLRSITDEIMYEIMELSGQEYVDKYAGVAKAEAQEAAKAAAAAAKAEAKEAAAAAKADARRAAALAKAEAATVAAKAEAVAEAAAVSDVAEVETVGADVAEAKEVAAAAKADARRAAAPAKAEAATAEAEVMAEVAAVSDVAEVETVGAAVAEAETVGAKTPTWTGLPTKFEGPGFNAIANDVTVETVELGSESDDADLAEEPLDVQGAPSDFSDAEAGAATQAEAEAEAAGGEPDETPRAS